MRSPRPSPKPQSDAPEWFAPAPLPVAALDDEARLACLRLIRSENVGPVTFRELVNHYGGAVAALDALPDLSRRGGRRRAIRICPKSVAEAELDSAARVGATPLFTIEPGYPPLLAHVEVPPPLVYVRGSIQLLSKPVVAIVGSRDCSAAGQKLARMLAQDLGAAGFVIASGLARGIDGAAHAAALSTGTIAVLAGGIDVVYPPEHAELQDRIGASGCLLTEQPPGFRPTAKDFPRRNRIISGISHGVIVVEAARRSGTLVTARMAAEQGREVFAVPGHPLDPRAEGTNALLKEGATLVTSAADVLTGLDGVMGVRRTEFREPEANTPAPPPIRPPPLLSDTERTQILQALGPAPIDIDTLQRATGLPARTVSVILMELDLAGRIERHGGQLVSLLPDVSELPGGS